MVFTTNPQGSTACATIKVEPGDVIAIDFEGSLMTLQRGDGRESARLALVGCRVTLKETVSDGSDGVLHLAMYRDKED